MDGATIALGQRSGELNLLAERYGRHAQRVSTFTLISSVTLYASAVLVIGLFFWRRGITQRLLAKSNAEQEILRFSEARFRSLIQNSSSIVTVLDKDLQISYQSSSVEKTLGYGHTDLWHRSFIDLIHPEDQAQISGILGQTMLKPGSTYSSECRLQSKTGSWIQAELIAQNLMEDPYVEGMVLTMNDIRERKVFEDQLLQQATHDQLTGLPNRLPYRDRLLHALERGLRPERCHAVIFLDLDDFKTVNDSLGHMAGDKFLMAVGERLRTSVRSRDTVSRFGGDEFAILLENTSESDVKETCLRILEAFQIPFKIGDRTIQGGLSMGVALVDHDGCDVDDLLRDADTAMYMAKARGKGRVEFFTPAMHIAVMDRVDLEAEMRVGIREDQFHVHYQPIINFAEKKVMGLEALLRWQHPERGLILPTTFIPIAEESSLILPLGAFVLTEACRQAHLWQTQYPSDPPIFMTVNLSARQLLDPHLLDQVELALAESGLAAKSLVLEITESVLAHNTSSVIKRLQALRTLGVQLAIDDFGTGYSSLSYLQQFPVDILKIDKSFIDSISDGKTGSALSEAIVSMGQALQLQTIAEGVERPDQIQHLNSIGCDLWQGFYFAQALAETEVDHLLSDPEGSFSTIEEEKLAS